MQFSVYVMIWASAAFTVVQGTVMTASVVWYAKYIQHLLLRWKDVHDSVNSIVDNAIGYEPAREGQMRGETNHVPTSLTRLMQNKAPKSRP